MGRYRSSDPTADTAIGNVDRDRRLDQQHRDGLRRKRRRLLDEFPHAFEGLILNDAKKVCFRAFALAGNDVWAIKEHHVNQARNEHDRREHGEAIE